MFLALGLGAYEVAVFHVITHAFFKASLFLGSVIHALQENKTCANGWIKKGNDNYIYNLNFITSYFRYTSFSGFSRDEILLVAFEHNKILWFIASLASLMTAFYMFRLLYLTFFKEFRGTAEKKSFT
jgi:NADH-quinone oxidoreductase subunit L